MTSERLVIYQRPGCGFCMRLVRTLDRAEVEYQSHDIWRDQEAAAFVRSHNNGNETVPTVVIDGEVFTNPDPAFVLDRLSG